MDFIFSLNPTFVARGFSGNIPQLTEILKAAIRHHGFAYVDVLQACPTYNAFATHEWLLAHCYDASTEGHDPADLKRARKIAVDTEKRVATGILYQTEDVPAFHERLRARQGVTSAPVDEVKIIDVSRWLKAFV
jgi:2-oxoglutarate ferredoxin oxidoreductase subunit beta